MTLDSSNSLLSIDLGVKLCRVATCVTWDSNSPIRLDGLVDARNGLGYGRNPEYV